MKATAKAPANIAFTKYWGKKDEQLRLPLNSSISMNIDGAYTVTTVEFLKDLEKDDVSFVGESATEKEITKIIKHLDRIRKRTHSSLKAKVVTKNSFPKGGGMASSASGFAALTVAACAAAGADLKEKDLTILARIGSGSACRSIPDGYVEWEEGHDSSSSFAYSIFPSSYWDLADVICIVDPGVKKVSTTTGMEMAATSPFFKQRLKDVGKTNTLVKTALSMRDFKMLGNLIELDAIQLHTICMTQVPPIYYWNGVTLEIIRYVQKLREEGLQVYFTIDAGPNVHLICEAKDMEKVAERAQSIKGVQRVIKNIVAPGAQLITNHLF